MSEFGDRLVSFFFGEAVGRSRWPEEDEALFDEDEPEEGIVPPDDDGLSDDDFQDVPFEDAPPSGYFTRAAVEPPPRSMSRPRTAPPRRRGRAPGVELRLYGASGEPLRRTRYEGASRHVEGIVREVLTEAASGLGAGARPKIVGLRLQVVDFARPEPPVLPFKTLGTYAVTLEDGGRRLSATPVRPAGLKLPPSSWYTPLP